MVVVGARVEVGTAVVALVAVETTAVEDDATVVAGPVAVAGGADAVELQAAVAASNISPIAGLRRRTLVTPKGLNGATGPTLRRRGPNPVPRAGRGRSRALRTKVTSLKCRCTPSAATLASSSVSGVLAHASVTVRYRTMRRDQFRATLAPNSACALLHDYLTSVKTVAGLG